MEKANALGILGVTQSSRGPDRPATQLTFIELARFVNWLNTVAGYTPAYNLTADGRWSLWPPEEAWTEGGINLYRHRNTHYFVPSADEWYKAAYYDGSRYYMYQTRTDNEPLEVASGTIGGTVVYMQPTEAEPASVDYSGGLSFYGTMAQGGNVREWIETAFDGVNDSTEEALQWRGGCWYDGRSGIRARGSLSGRPNSSNATLGFRLAARIPAGR